MMGGEATELGAEHPSSVEVARAMWSNYNHNYTGKFLGAITPIGGFAFTSDVYGGRITDTKLTEVCGFLDLIEHMDAVVADRYGLGVEVKVILTPPRIIIWG